MISQPHGVGRDEDIAPGLLQRDARPLRYKWSEAIATKKGYVWVAIGIIITIGPFINPDYVYIADFLLLISPIFWLYSRNKNPTYPFRKPVFPEQKNVDWEDGGIFILGNELDTGAMVAFSNSDLRTHMLVFGSTGSGKTRFLLGLIYQAMLVGAGAMYVDGKSDTDVYWLLYSLCRRLGRDDDLLVVNYLTGGESSSAGKDGRSLERISNTSNLLAQGSSEQLRSLIVGLMRDAGGDGAMWKGRASSMLKGLLNALVYLRDKGEINLDVELLREYMTLDRILEIYSRTDLPDAARIAVVRYLGELPGFTEQSVIEGQMNPEATKQHGFLQMQLTETLSDLSDTYGHIFKAPLGEVDFKDVVFNRRILFVMLPALEKDPDALAGLGKLVVAGVRSALAPALGNRLEGSKKELIDSKQTRSKVPFLIILDEYGFYSVKGFAVVAAQARSLGVACVFAGQDYPSFKKASAEEAASTVANTNIKCCMKLEDAKETADLMVSRGGDAYTTQVSGMSKERTMGYTDNLQAKTDKRKRISERDLVAQKPGQAHIIFGDSISRSQFFYADPKQSKYAQLNHFLMVDKGSSETIRRINSAYDQLQERLDRARTPEAETPAEWKESTDAGLELVFSDMEYAGERNQGYHQAAMYGIGLIDVRHQLKDELINAAANSNRSAPTEDKKPSEPIDFPADDDDDTSSIPGMDLPDAPESEEEESNIDSALSRLEAIKMAASDGQMSAAPRPGAGLSSIHETERPSESVADAAARSSSAFQELLTKAVTDTTNKGRPRPLSATEAEKIAPVEQLAATEELLGATRDQALKDARGGIEMLSEKIVYPSEPLPTKKPPVQLRDRLDNLRKLIDLEKNNHA